MINWNLRKKIQNLISGKKKGDGWEGVGQAKAVIFFIIVAIIMIIQLNITRKKEVES